MGHSSHSGCVISPSLSRVTKATGTHPPDRAKVEGESVVFDLKNARILP